MNVSMFDLFRIGIGPSSSHTVGPMRAAAMFAADLDRLGLLGNAARVRAELYGSLGATGKGHGTDRGVMLGLSGETPDTVDVDSVDARVSEVLGTGQLRLAGKRMIAFDARTDIAFFRQALPRHPNGLKLLSYAADGRELRQSVYFSIGGGFVVEEGNEDGGLHAMSSAPPYPFSSGEQLLAACRRHDMSIAQMLMANERAWRSESEIIAGTRRIWQAMQECVARGCRTRGTLPGTLGVPRRAPALHDRLLAGEHRGSDSSLAAMDWLNLFALAVSEENASGGRVVTAPTNGAAGIIPAVMHYYMRFIAGADEAGIREFLLTSAAIGALYKLNASISGAEVGCQGEVGVACSMAAGGLCAVLGGTPAQVEQAAEIGMEHNLGLTCDPVGGRVQIPCVERNAMGAVKAVSAARMTLNGDGTNVVSLDSVIRTMLQTGADMKAKYKETSRGGLAVNIVEC